MFLVSPVDRWLALCIAHFNVVYGGGQFESSCLTFRYLFVSFGHSVHGVTPGLLKGPFMHCLLLFNIGLGMLGCLPVLTYGDHAA